MQWLNRILLSALLAGAVAFVPQHIYAGSGGDDLVRVRREEDQLRQKNLELAQEIALLRAEVAALKRDPAEVARIAREDLNLIYPDEVVFEVETLEAKPARKP